MKELLEDQSLVLYEGCTGCGRILVDRNGKSLPDVFVDYHESPLGSPYCKDCFSKRSS